MDFELSWNKKIFLYIHFVDNETVAYLISEYVGALAATLGSVHSQAGQNSTKTGTVDVSIILSNSRSSMARIMGSAFYCHTFWSEVRFFTK